MALDKNKKIERSVDSVVRIYAVIIGLALSESVKTLITRDSSGAPDLSLKTLLSGAPAFVAFVTTLVPFWHGMNRHLDRCYLEKDGDVAEGALLFDFSVFFAEAGVLWVAGWALRSGLVTFYCLGILLFIDMVWGFISHQIHFPHEKSHVVGWIGINIAAGLLALGVMAFPFNWKATLLMVVAIVRSIADYWFGWDFYFPKANDGKVAGAQYAKYRILVLKG